MRIVSRLLSSGSRKFFLPTTTREKTISIVQGLSSLSYPFTRPSSSTGTRALVLQRRHMATWPKIRPKRLQVITMDVTGTVVSFRGTLEEHYLGAAIRCGVSNVDPSKINEAFNRAYQETSTQYPCFGGDTLTAKEWWRETVSKSFRYGGCVNLDPHVEDMIFQRIYSTFGSNAAYEIFPDALPFLHWARRNGIVCGVLSNADERYGDSILPMLGLTHDDLQFQIYSKDIKLEKPDPRVFMAAMNAGRSFLPTTSQQEGIEPSHVLHIGNHFKKDFVGARVAGMHSVLLDRYSEDELANEWRRRGAPVFKDLLDVVEFLGRSGCEFG